MYPSSPMAPKKLGPVAAKKKNKEVLLTYNPSWADKVENDKDKMMMMMNPVLEKRPKQQFKVPPALNHLTNTLGSSSSCTSALVDEFNYSALFDEEGISPVSDENYANQMQLQEVLMSAVISSTLRNTQPSEEEIPPSKKGKKVAKNNVGHTSQSRSFCNICFDHKGIEEMFPSTGCRHTFCKDCISRYVASKIHGNVTRIKCPDMNCREGDIGPDICREIVPKEVLERWDNVLCESLIIGSQKFYCPYKDCSAVMLNDGEEKVTSSECPNCRRLFCAQCNVAWHAGIDCSQFKSLNENERKNVDIMLVELAKKKKWRRCPKCQFYVEKKSGCLHITCRCGYEFCYGCGSIYTPSHACPPRGIARRRNTREIARRRNI